VVDQDREVAGGEAVAVPGRLDRAAASEQLDQRELDRHVGSRDADLHERTGVVAREERLAVRLRPADGLDDDVGTESVGERPHRVDGVLLRRVDDVGRPEPPCPLELAGVDVDGDDLAGPGQDGGGDGGVAHAATPDHRHRVATPDAPGVDRRAPSGHHAAPDEAGGLGSRRRVDLHRLPGGDEGLLHEGADAERRAQRGAVGERHRLRCVATVEAIPRPTAPTRPAVTTRRPPRQDDVVTGRETDDALSHRLHDTRRLVAEEEREVVVDASLPVVQVGVADPAGLHAHERLARTRVGNHDRLDRDRLAFGVSDDAADLLRGHE
jgi:hypothetical protein